MLRIYYGRENIDKERAMFDKIGQTMDKLGKDKCPSQIMLIVPDQYTLQMERNAISYLKVQGLMDLEVLSFSRLAGRVLQETGGSKRVPIDKYGRHMLLTKIMKDEEDNLFAFKGMSRSHSFISLANNLISEMKQYNSCPEEIRTACEQMEEDSLLKRKLSDIAIIFEKYEESIRGKYVDTEDHLQFFISKINKSMMVKRSEFWISGFDSFTPKAIEIIKELTFNSFGVNMVMTSDKRSEDKSLFQLTQTMMNRFEDTLGYEMVERIHLSKPYSYCQPPVKHLEENIFAYPYKEYGDGGGEAGSQGFHLVRAANFYNEVETAAKFIIDLVQEKGLRYRDFLVICNDMVERAAIIKRVFDEYGISHFIDRKHHGLHNPAIVFIRSLLDLIQSDKAYEDVFSLLKTGLCPISLGDVEDLENYALRYRIKGKGWEKDFIYGGSEYSEDEFEKLNYSRQALWEFIRVYEEKNLSATSVRERTEVLAWFLNEEVNLEERIEELCLELEEASEFEAALEMQQILESIGGLFDQLTELIGDEQVSHEDYSEILKSGFESIELGLIPTTIDQVLVGTMQRTRVGRVKALIVLAANDGILPANEDAESLLSKDEKVFLQEKEIVICKDDNYKSMEERLAIYKQLSKAEEYLWIGYSAADMEGKETRPSIIFDKITKIFPRIELEKDIRNKEDPMALLGGPESSLKHLAEAMRKAYNGEEALSPFWKATYNWYRERKHQGLALIKEGLNFTNRMENLERLLVSQLLGRQEGGTLRISPSRLERFSRCPFAHFVNYGLRPEEKRVFEVSNREVGDVYHQCLMNLSESLTVKGLPLNHKNSPWMQISREECAEKVSAIISQISVEYKEGMLAAGKEEIYRTERIQKVCERAAWALVEHVRQGQVKDIYFEQEFGQGDNKLFPAIEINIGDKEFLIEGKIDRIDVLPENYVKIIDYKSSREKFNMREALGGWRLQLMLYLKAVTEGMKANDIQAKPAGVFYFEIADSMVNASNFDKAVLLENIEAELRKQFKLDGLVIGESSVIENIAGNFSGFSDILPIRKNKDGKISGTTEGKLLTEDEFEDFSNSMDSVIKDLCASLANGVIDLTPKKNRDETACKYCEFKSICNFELSFDGCSYAVVK